MIDRDIVDKSCLTDFIRGDKVRAISGGTGIDLNDLQFAGMRYYYPNCIDRSG